MHLHAQLTDEELRSLITAGRIKLAGHRHLGIYGALDCRVGRRYMARVSRVFFATEAEAVLHGFRPCSTCMRERYSNWKARRAGAGVPAGRQLRAA